MFLFNKHRLTQQHPALGGGFGLGYKIQFGYDFVGDSYNGSNSFVPDPDPLDCGGHGTHVSGIIGAIAPTFTGVAPNATLGVYRVFGCNGGSGNDVIIAAFNAAYQAGAQIITASLGSPSGWTEDPLAVVINRIVDAGVSCTFAAGNDGKEGLFFASTAANGINVTAIGSVDSITTPQMLYEGRFTINNSVNTTFQYLPANNPFPEKISGYSLYALDYNITNPADACTELPSDTPTLSEKIVLIHRGTCTFLSKIANVQKFGAQYIIIYNNENPMINPQSPSEVFAGMVSAEQGGYWIARLQEGLTVNFYFPANSTATLINPSNNITGGSMSIFSSWSPTNDLYAKPEVSAPGGNILSTYPLHLGGYAVLSGTSMATPYIAGVIALYKNAKGPQTKIDSLTLRHILATTATPLFFNDGKKTYPYLAPVVQQGGGLVNAFATIHYTTIISPSTLNLNDTSYFKKTVSFTISNTGSAAVSYTLIHKGAATAYTLDVNTTLPQRFPPELTTQYATVIISPYVLTIPGKSTAVIRVTVTRPTCLEAKRIPVYSGYIYIQGSNKENFHLPYVGLGYNMKCVVVTDFENQFPYISNSSDTSQNPKPIGTNQTFIVSNGMPTINWRLVMSSPLVRVDILGSGKQINVAEMNILGSIPDYPSYWVSRNYFIKTDTSPLYYNVSWNGTLSTGIQVPAGNYRFLYRALKIFGNQDNKKDYEIWTSPMFNIQYEKH
ncbi:unnamed protein product [Rotaria sp. Silwood2]|nr:unnamed protein product [Rotaria sp. Silwood2]